MEDYPNREDACFYFDDPEELYWPKLTPEERENVRKAIEPHIIKVKQLCQYSAQVECFLFCLFAIADVKERSLKNKTVYG